MDTRRDFIKKAAMLAGAAGITSALPASIQKALSINPAEGSTYLDAEHVVYLMQENRSFDHCYGTLQGVRGYNDPRAINLPNKNKVWLQTNAKGETYAPFRLDIKNTKATWMRSLPHSWTDQVDARHNGKYDKWLDTKRSGHKEYEQMPLTMGYYNREDIPFYYAFADAFTVCDQHFCSSLTGTTPNRLYYWSGTIRAEQNENSQANVWNNDADHKNNVNWKTYPERLEENGVSWKVYQNDLSVEGGFEREKDSWMANYGDNPLEYFSQFNAKLSMRYINYLQGQLILLPKQIKELETKLQSGGLAGKEAEDATKELAKKKTAFKTIQSESALYTREKYDQLSEKEKNLHEKAFVINKKDPLFYQLTKLNYNDGATKQEVTVPAGDILYQFREDVNTGNLPTVSWLVAPENFSDHPSSAWYGAWYVSEVLDILTKNPEVWKKTIFVLTYDENDGYYDHVPPFVAPNPNDASTGKTSESIDARTEFVTLEQERRRKNAREKNLRESAIGLGYRVPMVIASPWSRGGWVNSQVFDLTSSLQFLEDFLAKKTNKKIEETNISTWRRAVCGDLTSAFRPYNGEKIENPTFVKRDEFIESIHQAQFKKLPTAFKQLTKTEIDEVNSKMHSPLVAKQEKGTRPSCALPYELYVDGKVNPAKKSIEIVFAAGKNRFGEKAAGSPFTVYAPGTYQGENMRVWNYAVAAGEKITDEWPIENFENGAYHLCVHGPNGFFREFKGSNSDPLLQINCVYNQAKLQLNFSGNAKHTVNIVDNAYNYAPVSKSLTGKEVLQLDTAKSFGWYDFSVTVKGFGGFEKRFAGRIETGKHSKSDPAMGNPKV